MARSSAPQIPCCVPHCARARLRRPGEDGDVEWLCPDHWRTVSPTARRRYKRLQQRVRKTGDATWGRLAFEQWRRLRTQAIERAAGIA